MTEVSLDGLDGLSPLGFFASLGVLRVLDDRARSARHEMAGPRMSWVDSGGWRPRVHGVSGLEEVIGAVLEDQPSWTNEPALRFAYDKGGELCAPDVRGAVRDLKPPPGVMRGFLMQVADLWATGKGRSARHAAAYGTDIATDNNGNTKPTSLHFTAGQQTFLSAVAEIHENLTREHIREALAGPWKRESTLKTAGWDPMGAFTARMYAMRASNPASEKRPGTPGAEWLAFIGMSFFPTFPVGTQVCTTCVRGGWKDSSLTWPLWDRPASARTIESLLRTPRLAQLQARQRAARGVVAICKASILRSDQGGYGAFAPTSVL